MEVTFAARVTSSPRFFFGTHTRCEHETFSVSTARGAMQIIDNVDIAPPVPVKPGDSIVVRGELVRDGGSTIPIVHWTHHDPGGTHPDGYIELRGRVYS